MRAVLKTRLPLRFVGLFLLLYFGALALESVNALIADLSSRSEFEVSPRAVVCGVAGFAYAAFRVIGFHPLLRPRYLAWLRLTPWSPHRPLPLGSVHLDWRDALVLVLLMLLSGDVSGRPDAGVVWGFAGGYLLASCLVLLYAFGLRYVYGIVFLLGLGAIAFPRLAWLASVAVVAYGVAYAGLRRSLASFPWNDLLEDGDHKVFGPIGLNVAAAEQWMRKRRVGFPFERLRAKPPCGPLSTEDALALSALAAWSLFVVTCYIDHQIERIELARVVAAFFPALVASGRVLHYCGPSRAPLSLWGRIVSGRFVIPAYDRVFLTPLATLVVGYAAGLPVLRHWIPPELGGPLVVFTTLAAALLGGPSCERWRLTGGHSARTFFNPGQFMRL